MSLSDLELFEGEQLMSDSEEIAYRQITSHLMGPDGCPASHAFGPASSDNGKPSYSRSMKVTAQEARDWHTANARTPSCGVWGVTVGEVISSGRYLVDDGDVELGEGEVRAPGHCFVDFRELTRKERKDLRAKLFMFAVDRGEISTEGHDGEATLF